MTPFPRTALVLLCCLAASIASVAACVSASAATPDEVRLLGSDREDTQYQSYMPFTRSLAASGIVQGSLADSTAAAGVPPAAMLEAREAFGAAIDLKRDIRDGDRFYVRYERTFTAAGTPIGTGRVLWAELRTAAECDGELRRTGEEGPYAEDREDVRDGPGRGDAERDGGGDADRGAG